MTKEQALQIIDTALAQMQLNRQQHQVLIEALSVLRK